MPGNVFKSGIYVFNRAVNVGDEYHVDALLHRGRNLFEFILRLFPLRYVLNGPEYPYGPRISVEGYLRLLVHDSLFPIGKYYAVVHAEEFVFRKRLLYPLSYRFPVVRMDAV